MCLCIGRRACIPAPACTTPFGGSAKQPGATRTSRRTPGYRQPAMAVTPDEVRAVEGEIALRVKEFDPSAAEVRALPSPQAATVATSGYRVFDPWRVCGWPRLPGGCLVDSTPLPPFFCAAALATSRPASGEALTQPFPSPTALPALADFAGDGSRPGTGYCGQGGRSIEPCWLARVLRR